MVVSDLALRSVHAVVHIYNFLWSWMVVTLQFLTFKYLKRESLVADGGGIPPRKQARHIGLVLVEDSIDLKEVAKVVGWCVESGSSCISVYDLAGYCKRNRSLLEENIEKLEGSKRRWSCAGPLGCDYTTKSTFNGLSSSPHLQLTTLSADDGRQSLVQVAREFSTAVACKKISIEDITPESIDNSLQERLCLPDPELVIVFGEPASLMGYLPWQCRLTEILCHPSHKNMKSTAFKSLLQSFLHTHQRFGK